MLVVILAALALASPSPASPTPVPTATPTPPPNAHVWQGITPGGQASAARARLGTPLLARSLPDGSQVDWYPGPSANAYMIVGGRDGTVLYVRAFPIDMAGTLDGLTDPYGVKPGYDYAAIKARRGEGHEARRIGPSSVAIDYPDAAGFVWLYELTPDGVRAITLYKQQLLKGAPAASSIGDPHDGLSIGRAYQLHAKSEAEGLTFMRYYAVHRGGCSLWTITNETILVTGARKVDQVDLECADDKSTTSLFFDVSALPKG